MDTGILRMLHRLRLLVLLAMAGTLAAGALLDRLPLAASVVLGLGAGVAYFYLLGWEVSRVGKSGIMNPAKVLMAKSRFLILIGAAIAAAKLPPLSILGTLAGVLATQVAFLVAIRRA